MIRLAVVDDECIVARGIEMIVKREKLDCQVVGVAGNGEEALEVIRRTQPDIVLADICMPDMDGLTLIEATIKENPQICFVVMSGYRKFEYVKKAMALGVKDYIEKPVTIDKVKEILEKVEEETFKKKALRMAENQGVRRKELDERINHMFDLIRQKKGKDLEKQFINYMRIIQVYFPNIGDFRRECFQVLCLVLEFYAEIEKKRNWHSSLSFERLETLGNFDEVVSYGTEIIQEMSGHLENENYDVHHRYIKELLDYIGSHYDQDISLTLLAERVHLSPTYLSMLFKEEVGISFIKYVTNLRIQKAKDYLYEDYKVYQVSALVGYNNYRHFVDIFKKYVGQSPKDYQSHIHIGQ